MNERMSYRFPLIALVAGLAAFITPFVLPTDTMASAVKEDHFFEWIGFFCLFLTSVTFFLSFLYCPTGNSLWKINTRRNYIFLGLALLFFFGAGEEISWGQRLLGYGTPETLEANKQDEVTLHNLPLFDPTNEDSLLNMNRMFTYFIFTFGFLVPLAALANQRVRQWLVNAGVPIAPLLLGAQLLLFFILSKFFDPLGVDEPVYEGRLVELREMEQALIFALIGLTFVLEYRAAKQSDNSAVTA